MSIDDPFDAVEQQYMTDEPTLPSKLAKIASDYGFKLALPDGGLALDILLKVDEIIFDKPSREERLLAIWELLKQEFRHVETTKASHEDVQRAIVKAMRYDSLERDDAKRARFVKLIGNALRSDEQVRDVASFIETLEQLNERDLIVLRVINKVMNKEGDWIPNPHPAHPNTQMTLHPSTVIGRRQELATQIAMALGQAIERNDFNREEGYAICNRLQGFGLAHELDQSRELPLADYVFRLSIQGVILLTLLGEEVPNYEYYRRR